MLRYQPVYAAVESSGSGVEFRTLDYENPGSNPGCGVKTLGKFVHSTLLSSLSCINESLAIDSGGYIVVAYGWMLPREAEMVSE